MLIELDKWTESVINAIPEGISKPKIVEYKDRKYYNYEDLIGVIEDLIEENERISDIAYKMSDEVQVLFKKSKESE